MAAAGVVAAGERVLRRGKVISLRLAAVVVVADRGSTAVVGLAGGRFLRVHLLRSIFQVLGGHRARPPAGVVVVQLELLLQCLGSVGLEGLVVGEGLQGLQGLQGVQDQTPDQTGQVLAVVQQATILSEIHL